MVSRKTTVLNICKKQAERIRKAARYFGTSNSEMIRLLCDNANIPDSKLPSTSQKKQITKDSDKDFKKTAAGDKEANDAIIRFFNRR
jgi:hypothetical protein